MPIEVTMPKFGLTMHEGTIQRYFKAPGDPVKQVELAYRIALSRPPRPEEAQLAAEFLGKRQLTDFTHVLLNLNEFLYVR